MSVAEVELGASSPGSVKDTANSMTASRPLAATLLDNGSASADSQCLSSDESALKVTVIVASLSNYCLGYNTGIIAGAILDIKKDPLFSGLGSLGQGFLVSCILAGAALGAAGGSVSERIGRRKTLLGLAVVYVIFPIIMAAAPSLHVLVGARFVVGLAVGVSSVLVNVYISEVAPAESRGRLGGMSPFLGTTGILTAFIVSTGLGYVSFSGNWRVQLGLACLPGLLMLLLQHRLPESPSWLLARGRRADADRSLQVLFPNAAAILREGELNRLDTDLASSHDRIQDGVKALCHQHRMATFIGLSMNLLQQFSGINIVIYFGPTILKEAGFNNTSAMIATAGVSVIQLCATGVLMKYVDHYGRKPMAIVGLFGMMVGLGFLISSFLVKGLIGFGQPILIGILAVAGMLFFRASFSLSLGPLPYIMTAELFPQEARAAGVSLCWFGNWSSNFAVSLSFPILVGVFPGPIGIAEILAVYVVFCLVALAFVVKFLPETRGLRLEDAAARPARQVSGPALGQKHLGVVSLDACGTITAARRTLFSFSRSLWR